MIAQMNLNDHVTVKLTKHGVNVLRDQHHQWQMHFSNALINHEYKDFVAPENNMYTAQMWSLIETFGDHIGMGRKDVFDMNFSLHKVNVQLHERTDNREIFKGREAFIALGQGKVLYHEENRETPIYIDDNDNLVNAGYMEYPDLLGTWYSTPKK